MSEVSIRQAGTADKPFLRRMQWLAILASPGLIRSMGEAKLRQMEDRAWAEWPQQDEVAFIADSADGVALGAVLLRVHERDGERVGGYRLAIAVDSYARGRGIGRLLMRRAREFALANGASYVSLSVDPANSTAIQLYRTEGYVDADAHGLVPMTLHLQADGDG